MSKDRSFWAFALYAVCILVAVVLVLWVVAPLIGILD